MVRSELVEQLARALERRLPGIKQRDIDQAVKLLQDALMEALAHGQRVEIRGFGSFALHRRRPKLARNPKTGDRVPLGARQAVHFKPGKELRDRVNGQRDTD